MGLGLRLGPTGGAISAPPDPLAVTGGARPSPAMNIVIRPPPAPPSRNPGSAPRSSGRSCDLDPLSKKWCMQRLYICTSYVQLYIEVVWTMEWVVPKCLK